MFLSASDAAIGGIPAPNGSTVAAVGPDGFLHTLNVDANGNLAVTTPAGGATAANQATEIAKLGAIAVSLAGTLATTTEAIAAAKAGTAFRASTGQVQVAGVSTLPTSPVLVALFQNPAGSGKTATVDVRGLSANAAGCFTITRDPTVTATGSGAVAAVNLLAGSTTSPGATLYQAGTTTPLAVTASTGKVEAIVIMGSNGTDRDPVAGREILPPGHALLVSFLPYALLAVAIQAAAAFDWREV